MQKNIRVEQSLLDQLDQLFKYKQEGVQVAIETFLALRKIALVSLKGYFTEPEIKALVDAYNGTLLTKSLQHRSEMIAAQIEDAETYDGTLSKWFGYKVTKDQVDDLSEKIRRLSDLQAFFLQEELYRFWNGPGYGSPMPDLDQFVRDRR